MKTRNLKKKDIPQIAHAWSSRGVKLEMDE